MSRKCIMGCTNWDGLHRFPRDLKRRAEWGRIIGVYPKTKRAYLCTSHFSDHYIFGGRVSKFALPNFPDSRKLNNLNWPVENIKPRNRFDQIAFSVGKVLPNLTQADRTERIISEFSDDSHKTFAETDNEAKPNNLMDDPLQENSNTEFSWKVENNAEESQEIFKQVEDFEIRKSSNRDMIIKGRFIQANDNFVVSYTPPKKWALQEKVKTLDEAVTQQLQQIKQLNRENYLLHKELRKLEKLVPKVSLMQAHNSNIYSQLKRYKKCKKSRTKRIKEKRLKKDEEGVA